MICIGNIDTEKTMMEQLDEYEVNGYKVSDLKPEDKEFIKGIATMIDTVDNFEPDIDTGSETMNKIVDEYVQGVLEDLVMQMLGELGLNLFSIMDNDECYCEQE